jgi:monomeric sarcosine oxidase
VLGIDRFPPGHDRGSSHGQTRIIRQAYFEHPDYVPLVQRSFELWHELERLSGLTLFHQVGLVQAGPPDGEVMHGVRQSAALHNLPIENLTPRDAAGRFPGFAFRSDHEVVFESRAGYLLVESCVRAHAAQAQSHGAELRIGEEVRAWRITGDDVVVETDRDSYLADHLVICAGPWAGQVLADLQIPFEVRRKPLFWFQTRSEVYRAEQGCPAFLYDLEDGCFYGVPQIDPLGIKVAEHTGGAGVSDPLEVNRQLDVEELERVAHFVGHYIAEAATYCTNHAVCMYTMTPDAHFVVDRHPSHPRVAFAAGLSGHGFKFTCVLGEALAQLTLDGQSTLPIAFLSANRPALRATP